MPSPELRSEASSVLRWSRAAALVAAFAALTLGVTPEVFEGTEHSAVLADDDDDDDVRRARAGREGTAPRQATRLQRAGRDPLGVPTTATRPVTPSVLARAMMPAQVGFELEEPPSAGPCIPGGARALVRRGRAWATERAPDARVARAALGSREVPPRAGPDPPAARPRRPAISSRSRRAMARASMAAARPHRCEDRSFHCARPRSAMPMHAPSGLETYVHAQSEVS